MTTTSKTTTRSAESAAPSVIDHYLYLLDQAFETGRWHSLLGNLGDVTADDWESRPTGGARSIRQIVEHVGECKVMYESYAFGDGSRQWGEIPPEVTATKERAIEWLRQVHDRLRRSIAGLKDDDELLRTRTTNWGDLEETRWIVGVMIEHDHYHAGEIDHIRSLRSGDDRWAHEREIDPTSTT